MPKSRHRAPAAGLRQWIVWSVAALVVTAAFAFVSPLSGGPAPAAWTFLLLLLCFATGSVASSMFLSRPFRRGEHIVLPAVREPQAIERAPIERERTRPQPVTATPRPRGARPEAEMPTFTSSSEIGGSVGITVLIAGDDGSASPAGDVAGVGLADLGGVQVVDDIPEQKPRGPEDESETAARKSESGPYPGSVRPKRNGQSPDSGYRVKGNVRSKRYHTMQSPYYERTKASVWFRSTADAERAGFSAWNSRAKTAI